MRRIAAVPRRGAVLLLLGCTLNGAHAQEAEPFRTRNLSPLVSIFGLPAWQTRVPTAGTRVDFTSELANHYRFSHRGDDILILDGETWRSAVTLRHTFASRWTVGFELPYYRQFGGVLDDLIDAWHSAFSMPDGGGNRRAEDQLVYVLADEHGPFYALDSSGSGFGDLQISFGRAVGENGRFLLQGTLKLPTGDEDVLAGSGAADMAVTLTRSRPARFAGREAGLFWGAGVLALGEPEAVRYDTKQTAVLGMLGGSWQPWERTGLKAQIDVHGPLYDSRLEEIGDPGVQATIGAFREIGGRGVVEVAVNEDLAVSTSPDVVLHLTFRWAFTD